MKVLTGCTLILRIQGLENKGYIVYYYGTYYRLHHNLKKVLLLTTKIHLCEKFK